MDGTVRRIPGAIRIQLRCNSNSEEMMSGMACPEGIEPPTHSLEGS